VALDRRKIETLAASGALDRFAIRRDFIGPASRAYKDAMEAEEKALRKAEKEAKKIEAKAAKKGSAQVSLFGVSAPTPAPIEARTPPAFADVFRALEVPKEARWTWQMRLSKEEKAVGMVLSSAPLLRWSDLAPVLRTHPIGALATVPPRMAVAIVGRIRSIFTRVTKTGNTMGFVEVVDESGSTEVTLFSNVLFVAKAILSVGAGVVVRGTLDRPGPTGVLIAGSVEELDTIRERGARLVRIGNLGRPLPVPAPDVEDVLLAHPGACPVRVNGEVPGDWADRLARCTVTPSAALFNDLERTFGAPGHARAIL
jgi:DNA polymerase III alpha subunit